MDEQTGIWWSIGHLFYKFFGGLEWMYESINPNKICIALAFGCFAWWMKMQADYNKKALKSGGYK